MIKSNNESPGEIHPLALNQLTAYQVMASMWPRYPDQRAMRCGKCDQALWFFTDSNGHVFTYKEHEHESLIVAHIRQNHSEAINAVDQKAN